jgi:hypothetical protein
LWRKRKIETEYFSRFSDVLKGIAGELVGVNLTKYKRKPFLGGVSEVL